MAISDAWPLEVACPGRRSGSVVRPVG